MKQYKKYMKLAYKEMLKTNNFHNCQKYYAPLVGALLLYSDGTYLLAHRDEAQVFKHAENILLDYIDKEKLNDQAILFVTLEPCVPYVGRNHLLSCSELIVKNHIKNVCIGMVDPNPHIQNKGTAFLKEHQVHVSFFDKTIAKKIMKKNKAFIKFIKQEKK